MKFPTQKQIAEVVGVSEMTVGLVLRAVPGGRQGRKRVSDATRERILQVARELGYRPHRQAQILRGGKSGMIGMIKSLSFHQPNLEMVRAVALSLQEAYYKLLTCEIISGKIGIVDDFNIMLDTRVEGLLIQGSVSAVAVMNPTVFEPFRKAGIPIVILYGPQGYGLPTVGADQRQGMRDLVRHVVERGCRRLVHVSLLAPSGEPTPRTWLNQSRLQGFHEGIKLAQPHSIEAEVLHQSKQAGVSDFQAGSDAAETLLERGNLPDAVLCHNDTMAVGLIGRFFKAGVVVPRDLCVTGFDDTDLSRFSVPPLTTVRQPCTQMGVRAVAALLERIKAGKTADSGGDIQLPCEVVVRETTAAYL